MTQVQFVILRHGQAGSNVACPDGQGIRGKDVTLEDLRRLADGHLTKVSFGDYFPDGLRSMVLRPPKPMLATLQIVVNENSGTFICLYLRI